MRRTVYLNAVMLSILLVLLYTIGAYADVPEVDTEGAISVYNQLFSDDLSKQDVQIVSQSEAHTAPVVIARLENEKLAYMVSGEPFYPRALETGWWDTRIPDEATGNETLRTDTDWDYVFRDMSDIGANTVQLMVYWSDWEPSQGVYDYSFLDAVIEKAASYGIKTELIIFLHSHAVSAIPRGQDDFWAYHVDDRGGKSYGIQWGTGALNNTAEFRRVAAPGNGQEIFLEYWHPEVYSKLMNALTDLASHYADSPNVIGYQLGNEEGFNYYVNNGNDQNPYYGEMKRLYLADHPGANERAFRIDMVNNLWISMNNAIHIGDPYKPTTSNLQTGITEKTGTAYNPNDGSTMEFYENVDMIGSMFYGEAEKIYPNLDTTYNGGNATNLHYATTLPLLFPTEIGANVSSGRVLRIIAAETMARGGQGFGVYCYGELYVNAKDYKNSAPKPSRSHTKNLFSAVERLEDIIWEGLPVTGQTTQNIYMTPASNTYNPTLSVLEQDADHALGMLYFKGALGNVNEENRTRNVNITVKKAGNYSVEILLTNAAETPEQIYENIPANGSFSVSVETTNANVAFIRVTRTDQEIPEELLDGSYTIRSADSGRYLTTEERSIGIQADIFAIQAEDEAEAITWELERRSDGTYYVLNGNKGLNIRFRGNNSNHVIVFDKNDNPNQHWRISPQADGTYALTNIHTSQCMDSLGQTEAGALIEQRPASEAVSQRWVITPRSAE